MSDSKAGNGPPDLQFDLVVTTSPSATAPSSATSQPSVVCESCHALVDTEYYHVNGGIFCGSCRTAIEAAADTPRGLAPFFMAGLFGLGAGIAGAAIYYAVIAIANLEIGIVAILIGYMVGYAVRKGARGRGGRRFQVLAVVLTYLSVAFAYTPLVIKGAMADGKAGKASPATSDTASAGRRADNGSAPTAPSGGRILLSFALLFAFIAVLPVLVVAGSLPMGLISAFIIFIGMKQAWRMTGTPRLDILGPYRVGADPASLPA
jgi:hypothetical protein